MADPHTNILRTCEKCSENVRLYIVCFKCDFIYHPNCWRKLPDAYLNEKGHAFCCWNLPLNQDVPIKDLEMEEHVEEIIKEEDEFDYNDVSGNSQLRGDDLIKQDGELKKYQCAYCKYATNAKADLMRHIRTHTNDRPFKCTYKNCECAAGQEEFCKCVGCLYAATQEFHLKRHILTKHSREAKKYKCADCNYTAHEKHQLNRHIRTHTNDRPFKCIYKNCKCTAGQEDSCKCEMCGYAASRKCYLKLHIFAKHSGEPKKYKCTDCKYTAHQKSDLKRHSRTHSHDRPFQCTYKNCSCTATQEELCKCDMCGFAAAELNNLKVHILRKHSGKPKKYKCTDCKYTAHLKFELERHIRTHIKDRHRPFKCTYKYCNCVPEQKESCECFTCTYSATLSYHLNRHILKRHSRKSTDTRDCQKDPLPIKAVQLHI